MKLWLRIALTQGDLLFLDGMIPKFCMVSTLAIPSVMYGGKLAHVKRACMTALFFCCTKKR